MSYSINEFKKGEHVWATTIINELPVTIEEYEVDEEVTTKDEVIRIKNLTFGRFEFVHPNTSVYKTKKEAYDDAVNEILKELDRIYNTFLKIRNQM